MRNTRARQQLVGGLVGGMWETRTRLQLRGFQGCGPPWFSAVGDMAQLQSTQVPKYLLYFIWAGGVLHLCLPKLP